MQGRFVDTTLIDFVSDINLMGPRSRYYDQQGYATGTQDNNNPSGEHEGNAGLHHGSSGGASTPEYSPGGSQTQALAAGGIMRSKRRRVITVVQRQAANVRERKRMFGLNEAFDELRTKVPTFTYEKRLSRIETLRLAMVYIAFMRDLLENT